MEINLKTQANGRSNKVVNAALKGWHPSSEVEIENMVSEMYMQGSVLQGKAD